MALVVLDASVTIGLLDSADAHHDPAVAAVRRYADADLVLPVSAYAETLVGWARRRLLAVARDELDGLGIRVEPLTRAIAESAASLRATQAVRFADALVLATGDALGADAVLTADDRWRSVSVRVELLTARRGRRRR